MSVQRSPPKTPCTQMENKTSDSDSTSRNETSKTTRSPKMMPRNKRKRVGDDSLNDSLSTLKNDLMELINSKFQALHADILNDLKNHNVELNKNLEFMSNKYEDMRMKFEEHDRERKEYIKYTQDLEDRIEVFEKNSRSSSIEIKNIPKKQGESKLDLPKLTQCIGKALNLDIPASEIQDAYRVNLKSNDNPPIVVKFTTVFRKEEFMRKAKREIKANPARLSAQIRAVGYPAGQIFVAEHLTAKTRRLFMLARDYAKSNEFQFCWCSFGRIFLRKKEGAPHMLIKNEKQLDGLKIKQ